MAFFFPFSTLHELNLDWIMDRVKTLWEQADDNNQKADYAVETADEAKQIAEQAAQAQIGDGAVTTVKLADSAVTTIKLADDAVTSAKIKDGEVKNSDLADDAVTTAKIMNSSVTRIKIMDGEVVTDKLASAAVTNGKIADGAVTAVKLASDSVKTAKIEDEAVTTAKLDTTLQQMVTNFNTYWDEVSIYAEDMNTLPAGRIVIGKWEASQTLHPPTTSTGNAGMFIHYGTSTTKVQFALIMAYPRIYVRNYTSGSWSNWAYTTIQ